jgi:hypothetical protein
VAQDAAVWLMHGVGLALRHILGYATFILLCVQPHKRMNPTRVDLGIVKSYRRHGFCPYKLRRQANPDELAG